MEPLRQKRTAATEGTTDGMGCLVGLESRQELGMELIFSRVNVLRLWGLRPRLNEYMEQWSEDHCHVDMLLLFSDLCIRIIHADTMSLYPLSHVSICKLYQCVRSTARGLYLTAQSCCAMGKLVSPILLSIMELLRLKSSKVYIDIQQLKSRTF